MCPIVTQIVSNAEGDQRGRLGGGKPPISGQFGEFLGGTIPPFCGVVGDSSRAYRGKPHPENLSSGPYESSQYKGRETPPLLGVMIPPFCGVQLWYPRGWAVGMLARHRHPHLDPVDDEGRPSRRLSDFSVNAILGLTQQQPDNEDVEPAGPTSRVISESFDRLYTGVYAEHQGQG